MPRTGKNNERTEQVPRGRKKLTKIEPFRPQAEHPDKLYNDLAKFPSENPYPVLRIHRDGTVLYANKASEPLLKARDSAIGKPAPQEWRWLVKEVLVSGCVAMEEVKDNGRVFAFRVVPITESDYVNFYGVDITEQKLAKEEREITIKLLSLINSRNQVHDLMKLVTAILRDWSGCEAVGIRLQDGEDFPYFETSGFPDEFVQAESKLCSLNKLGEPVRDSRGRVYLECMCGNIISDRFDPSKPFFTKHGSFWTNSTIKLLASTTNADRLAKTRNRCNTAGYESVALIPLRTGNETFGLLQFNSKQKDQFTPEKISLLERLADNLAIGLAQRRAEQALKTSEERFRSLFEQAADAIVVIDARTGEMAEFNDKAHQMLGYTRTEYAKLRLSDIEAIESKEEVAAHIDKVVRQGSDIFEAKQRKKDGTPCDVLVSSKLITVAGKPYLQAIWRDITELKKAEGTLLEYQKQLKQLASQLALTEERERRRIAGKIHDEISQTLAMAKIKLDTLQSSPPSEASSAAIEEISSYIEKVIQETRTLTFELSNPILYELGFEVAVAEWLSEQVQEKHGIVTEFQDDGKSKPLDNDMRILLFRNVRELLINCIKHANAGRVRVNIRRTDGSIEVVVEDNGVGFDPAEVRSTAGKRAKFGLFSIRESLENLGGHFIIESKPGTGCKAIMTAPLKDQSNK